MPRRPDLLPALRGRGVTIVEVNDWRDRGADDLTPAGGMNHHTAGSRNGYAPTLGYVIANNLCNVLQSRQQDHRGLDICYLVGAGRANHAGKGAWRGRTGNRFFFGLEVEHTGTAAEPFPPGRYLTSLLVQAAFADVGGYGAADVCQHWEYADNPPGWPGRKPDFARAHVDAARFRDDVADLLAPPQQQQEDDMPLIPSWARRQSNGRWPIFDVTDRSPTSCTVLASAGAPFAAGLNKIPNPQFTYGAAFGLSTLRVTGLPAPPRGVAEAPGGAVLLVCADGSTYDIARKP